eukprot:Hpha_TRINITY_DN14954_c0_g1::TRINITY_DN14954_c0_g1_i1::g.143825::m.143825
MRGRPYDRRGCCALAVLSLAITCAAQSTCACLSPAEILARLGGPISQSGGKIRLETETGAVGEFDEAYGSRCEKWDGIPQSQRPEFVPADNTLFLRVPVKARALCSGTTP